MASRTQEVEHEIVVLAPAGKVYPLIADVRQWPRVFPPTVLAEQVESDGRTERIRIWATANGVPKNWTSRRTLDPEGMRIEFRQEVPTAPVGAMGGAWVVEPVSAQECRVRLLHDYRALDDDPATLAWIDRAVDTNSRAELAALKANVEQGEDQLLSFTDTVRVAGAAEDVYDFLREADRWEERLPHVASVSLHEDPPGLQVLEMDTRTRDGSTHTTRSVRVCFPHSLIVYKQTVLPALMNLHTGAWRLNEDADGVTVSSQHTVAVNTDNITAVLGPDADLPRARQFIRTALGANSTATLEHAKRYAEERV